SCSIPPSSPLCLLCAGCSLGGRSFGPAAPCPVGPHPRPTPTGAVSVLGHRQRRLLRSPTPASVSYTRKPMLLTPVVMPPPAPLRAPAADGLQGRAGVG